MKTNLKLTAVSVAALMLASAPALAQSKSAKPTLSLGGFYDQKLSITGQDNDQGNSDSGVRVRNDVEVYFVGNATLDNGIKIYTRVELEGGTNAATQTTDGGNNVNSGDNTYDQIDEAFMTISGSFGSIKAGMTDSAPKSMTTGLQGVWSQHAGENVSFNAWKLFDKPATVSTRSTPAGQMDLNSDGENISYTTPSFGGFQASVSYGWNAIETFDGHSTSATEGDTNIWAASARYSGKVGDTSFAIGGGYTTSDETTLNKDDDEQYMIGGKVSFMGIGLGASWSRQAEAKTSGVTATIGIDTIELGASYEFGPNTVSLVYAGSKADSTVATADGDKDTTIAVAFARSLGKGVTWHNTLFYVNQDDNNPAATSTTSNDGYAFTTGLLLKF